MSRAVYVTYFYPHVMALLFLGFFFATKIPARWQFLGRGLVALLIALLLAHVNRIFGWWPAHLYFASGHMTFSLGVALSLGMLRPWTLWITLPLLIPFGAALVLLRFHDLVDIVGAIVIVLGVYGSLERVWGLSPGAIAGKAVLQPVRVRGGK